MKNKKKLDNSNSTGGKNKSTQLVERKHIEGTPFTAVKIENQPYFLTLGKYRLQYAANTLDELLDLIDSEKWNIIIDICQIITEFNIKNLQNNE